MAVISVSLASLVLSISHRSEMTTIPIKSEIPLATLCPGLANSMLTISVQAIYKKVPPERLKKIMTTKGLEPVTFMPIMIPIGPIRANKNKYPKIYLLVYSVCASDDPMEITVVPLWRTIPTANYQAYTKSTKSPRAIPSNTACTERATTSTSPADLLTISIASPFSLSSAYSVPISVVFIVFSGTPSNPVLTSVLSSYFISASPLGVGRLATLFDIAAAPLENITLSIRRMRQ